jgi:hypothetical protein
MHFPKGIYSCLLPQLPILVLLLCRVAPKKVSAAAFSSDGAHAFFADKFGDVLVVQTKGDEPEGPPSDPSPDPSGEGNGKGGFTVLLGHFCSIITSLWVSPDGHFLVSTDRDNKVRVSVLPANPMQVRWPSLTPDHVWEGLGQGCN